MTIQIIYKPTNTVSLEIKSDSAMLAIMAVQDFRVFQLKSYSWRVK